MQEDHPLVRVSAQQLVGAGQQRAAPPLHAALQLPVVVQLRGRSTYRRKQEARVVEAAQLSGRAGIPRHTLLAHLTGPNPSAPPLHAMCKL